MSGLGRREPTDRAHEEKFPLSALDTPPTGVPGVLGINWYTNFDSPVKDGDIWRIGKGNLGSVRGGHCIATKAEEIHDVQAGWVFYNQGEEGACVGFGSSRMMSMLNRHLYDAKWLYEQAQLADEFADTPPEEGTSVRAGLSILKKLGHVLTNEKHEDENDGEPLRGQGIKAYRWATSWDEVRTTLGVPDDQDGVDLLNSWGKAYPHIVRLEDSVGERLLKENGEFGLVTDR